MKILAQAVSGSHIYGFKKLFENAGHQWIWWEEAHTPAFDVFDEVKPGLYIGVGANSQSRAVKRCLGIYKTPTIFEISPFVYAVGENELSYPVLADSSVYRAGEVNEGLRCDIACCEIPDRNLMGICEPIGKFNIKVATQRPLSIPQYMGVTTELDRLKLYQSASIVYANTAEEAAKGLMCDCRAVTSNKSLVNIFSGHCVLVSSTKELSDFCSEVLKSTLPYDGADIILGNGYTYASAFDNISSCLSKKMGVQL